MIIRLRGHHILCLLGFRGFGYSDEFVANMASCQSRAFSDNSIVEIISGSDDICRACPKKDDAECRRANGEGVSLKDQVVLEMLQIPVGSRLASSAIFKRVANHIAVADLERICADCEWLSLGYCADGIRKLAGGGCTLSSHPKQRETLT